MDGAELSAGVDLEQMGPWSNSGWKGPLEVTHPTAWGTKQIWFCQVACAVEFPVACCYEILELYFFYAVVVTG